ncbi:MAG: shikimate dehydrogenase [Nesterenkonia sp.]
MSTAAMRAAVLGSPISHSKSPQLHAAAYHYLGADLIYSRIELGVEQAGEFLRENAEAFTGFSVTMPLKAVMVEKMSTVSERVRTLGVLNTITVERTDDGPPTLRGENTDVDGITAALRESGLQTAGGTSIAVIGAGATASAALAAAAEMGFSTARIYARSAQRAAAAAPLAHQLGLRSEVRALDQLPGDLTDPQVRAVVSTLPPRAADSLAAELRPFGRALPLLDVAYDPWPSALATGWKAAGGVVVSGMQMLLHQAVKQVELFTSCTSRPAASLSAAEHAELVQRMRAAVEL